MGGKPNITYSGFKGFQNQGLWRTATGLGLAFDHCFAQGGDHSLDPFPFGHLFIHFLYPFPIGHPSFPLLPVPQQKNRAEISKLMSSRG